MRLAEYGWKPHRAFLGSKKNLSRASMYWNMHEKQGGTVSPNSRFQQYSANLFIKDVVSRHMWMCAQRNGYRARTKVVLVKVVF